ncbi:heavy-metal-associated domain-containing protein [bacterium]|nr:heavy-metal-associated domain-containing protein [bacterium]
MAKNKTTLQIAGMSCEHCVKTVTNALEELDGVKKAKVNLKRGEAKVTYDSDEINVDGLITAVIEAGYEAKA